MIKSIVILIKKSLDYKVNYFIILLDIKSDYNERYELGIACIYLLRGSVIWTLVCLMSMLNIEFTQVYNFTTCRNK